MKQRNLFSSCAGLLLAAALLAAAPAIKSGFITTSDGVRLHYLESGSGPGILFVPGWTMPADIWEHQIRHFAARWRVVAMDPRSQGESDKPTEGHYPERRAQDIKEVVDQLKLAPVVLVGWSMGVTESLTYVEQFGTATLRAVVLVDGSIADERKPEETAQMWQWLKAAQVNRKEFAAKFVRSMYSQPQPEAYYERITNASLRTPTNSAITLIANVERRGDWRPVLAKLDRPTLYVYAPRMKAQAAMLKAALPAARLELFAQAGHALFVDEAARFNRLLEEFLDAAR